MPGPEQAIGRTIEEWDADEREERVIAYEDGTSEIVVDAEGATVDLSRDGHKYLRHPTQNPGDTFIALEGTLPDGSKAEWLISQDKTVLIETDKEGVTYGSAGPTEEALLQALREREFTIGRGVDIFDFVTLDSVTAEYQAGNVPYATETRTGMSRFSDIKELLKQGLLEE